MIPIALLVWTTALSDDAHAQSSFLAAEVTGSLGLVTSAPPKNHSLGAGLQGYLMARLSDLAYLGLESSIDGWFSAPGDGSRHPQVTSVSPTFMLISSDGWTPQYYLRIGGGWHKLNTDGDFRPGASLGAGLHVQQPGSNLFKISLGTRYSTVFTPDRLFQHASITIGFALR